MPFTPIRINCGGSLFNDAATGKTWAADAYYSGGSTYTGTFAITCTHPSEDAPVYRPTRYGPITYTIPVPSGNYKVVLKLAEIYWTATGKRIFSISLNGTTVLSNIDLVAITGPQGSIDYCYLLTGITTVTITLIPNVDNATINAIDIVDATTPAAFFGVSPTNVTLLPSATQQFVAKVDYATGITWSISPNIGSISSTGLYTAPSSFTNGQIITVTAAETGNLSNQASTTFTLWNYTVGGKILRLPLTGNIYNEIRLFPNSFSVVSTGIPNSVIALKNISGYNSVTGSGDRRAIINITASASTLSGTLNIAVDGSKTGTGTNFVTNASVTGLWVQFDFLDRAIITEAIYYQADTSAQGTWQWQGSNDAVSWTNIGSSFALGGVANQVITALAGNTTGYRYYRILGVSGSCTSTPAIYEWEFNSNFDPTETYSYLKLGGTGDRRTLIIATSSGITWGSGNATNLINGTAVTDCWWWGTSSAYLQWDFGISVVINEVTWKQDQPTTHGTWQFQGSSNATTWTNLGSTFTLGGSMISTINIGGNTTAYRYYRMTLISGSTSSTPYLYEIEFKIGDGMPTPLLGRGGSLTVSTIRLNYGVLQTSVLPSVTVPHGFLKVTGTIPVPYKYTVIPPGLLKVHGSIPVPVTFIIPPVPHGVLKVHGTIPTPRARGVTWVTVPHGILKIRGIAPVPNPIIEPVLVPRGNVIVSGKTLTPVGYSVPPPSTEVGGNRSGNRIIYHF